MDTKPNNNDVLDQEFESYRTEKQAREEVERREAEERFNREMEQRAAEMAEEQRKIIKSRERHLQAIAVELRKIAKQSDPVLSIVVDADKGNIIVDGVGTREYLTWTKTYARRSSVMYRGKRVIGDRLVVGKYGEQRSYPQRKDGTYNYEEIAYRLWTCARYKIFEREKAAAEARNRDSAIRMCKRFGLELHSTSRGCKPSIVPGKQVHLEITIEQDLTETEATELLTQLQALKII